MPETTQVRTLNRAGGCCTCQQTVMCKPRDIDAMYPPYMDDYPANRWKTCEHKLCGVRCEGSGTIPQGITEPLTEAEAQSVLGRVVHCL